MNQPAPSQFFRSRADRYDATVDWPKRLAHEAPFYRRLFERVDVHRVLDVACGPGHHANMFHSWGLSVEGADVSPDMLARCRLRFPESQSLRWVERSFEHAHPRGGFDVAICVGNSLSIASDLKQVERVVSSMLAAVRSGGACVIHVLNLWRIAEGPVTWQKCMRLSSAPATPPAPGASAAADAADETGRERLLLKGIHRIGGRGYIEVLELELTGGGVTHHAETSTLLGIEASDLRTFAEKHGAREIQLFGDYHESPYERDGSQDLIIVARRG